MFYLITESGRLYKQEKITDIYDIIKELGLKVGSYEVLDTKES